jgi:hypothetical protein
MTMFEEHNVNELVKEPATINWNNFIDPWSRTDHFEAQKVVAIDFDETISDNPGTWLQIMKAMELGGYVVYVVTWRSPTTAPEELQFLVDKGYRIFYTSFKAKKPFMEALGIKVSIWCDDNPAAILEDAKTIWN